MRGPQISEKRAYAVLELTPPVSREKLMTAYRKMALKHHPDKGGDAEKFREVTDAKNFILKNPYRGEDGTVVSVVEDDDFDDVLLKKFLKDIELKKMKDEQVNVVVSIIKTLTPFVKLLDVLIYEDNEVIIQRKTMGAVWLISVDAYGNIMLQMDGFNGYDDISIFKIFKYSEVRTVVKEFIKNQ